MKLSVVSANEWLYPDVFTYQSASGSISLHVPRGGYAAVQVLIPGTDPGDKISIACENLPAPECYREIDARVLYNTGERIGDWTLPEGAPKPDYATRRAPFRVFDGLMPFERGGDIAEKETTALYLCWKIDRDADPGSLSGSVKIAVGGGEAVIPAEIIVHKARLPEKETLSLAVFGWTESFPERYKTPMYSDAWFEMYRKLLKLLRRARETHILIPLSLVGVKETGKDEYAFDFSMVKKVCDLVLSMGFPALELGDVCGKDYNLNDRYDIFYRPNKRRVPADSDEGYAFLSQFLPAWAAFLKENGYWEHAIQHVGDEPGQSLADNYRILCGIVRKFMPGMKLFNAVSIPTLRGALDCWIPLNCDYQRHRDTFEFFRKSGDELWFYTACGPGGKWLNRLMDMELLRSRLLHWANYRYDLKGYLHWAFNYWNDDQPDLFEYAHSVINDGTTLLPAGDTHICYPGDGEGPWMSIRAEQMRMGAEDYELLRIVSQKDKGEADRICLNVLRTFDDYTAQAPAFGDNYIALLEAADKLEE